MKFIQTLRSKLFTDQVFSTLPQYFLLIVGVLISSKGYFTEMVPLTVFECTAIPEIFLFIAILIHILIYVFNVSFLEERKFLFIIFSITIILLIDQYNFYHLDLSNSILSFNNIFVIDAISNKIKIFTLFLGMICILFSNRENSSIYKIHFNIFLMFIILGSMLMVSSYHLIFLLLSMEIQTFALFIMVALNKNTILGKESLLKYILINGFVAALYMIGTAILYYREGTLCLSELFMLYSFKNENEILIDSFPVILILLSFLFKLPLVPLHAWLLDIISTSSVLICFVLLVIPKFSIIVISTKVMSTFILCNHSIAIFMTLVISASFIIGSIGALLKKNWKSIFAYSTIANMAQIMTCLITFNNKAAFVSMFAYMLSLTTVMLIISYFFSKKNSKEYNNITDLFRELGKYLELDVFVLLIFNICSIAGLPPFIGFYGKLGVMANLVSNENYLLVIIMLLTGIPIVFYYIRLVIISTSVFSTKAPQTQFYENNLILFTIRILGFIHIFFSLFPQYLFTFVDHF